MLEVWCATWSRASIKMVHSHSKKTTFPIMVSSLPETNPTSGESDIWDT